MSNGSSSIFDSTAQAIVVTVNTGGDDHRGAMGKGIAAQAKGKYGDALYTPYLAACALGYLEVGDEGVAQAMTVKVGGKHIILAPTKDDWRNRSHLTWVRGAMQAIIREVIEQDISSVAIPALGCGEGGLDWKDVEPLIKAGAERLVEIGVMVEVYDIHGNVRTFMPTAPGNNAPRRAADTTLGSYQLVHASGNLPEDVLYCGRGPKLDKSGDRGSIPDPDAALIAELRKGNWAVLNSPRYKGMFGNPCPKGKPCAHNAQVIHTSLDQVLACYEDHLVARLRQERPEYKEVDLLFKQAYIIVMKHFHNLGCFCGRINCCHTGIMARIYEAAVQARAARNKAEKAQ